VLPHFKSIVWWGVGVTVAGRTQSDHEANLFAESVRPKIGLSTPAGQGIGQPIGDLGGNASFIGSSLH
jgi:hypothetical protein